MTIHPGYNEISDDAAAALRDSTVCASRFRDGTYIASAAIRAQQPPAVERLEVTVTSSGEGGIVATPRRGELRGPDAVKLRGTSLEDAAALVFEHVSRFRRGDEVPLVIVDDPELAKILTSPDLEVRAYARPERAEGAAMLGKDAQPDSQVAAPEAPDPVPRHPLLNRDREAREGRRSR